MNSSRRRPFACKIQLSRVEWREKHTAVRSTSVQAINQEPYVVSLGTHDCVGCTCTAVIVTMTCE